MLKREAHLRCIGLCHVQMKLLDRSKIVEYYYNDVRAIVVVRLTFPCMMYTGHLTFLILLMLGKISKHARSRDGVITRRPDMIGECSTRPATGRREAR